MYYLLNLFEAILLLQDNKLKSATDRFYYFYYIVHSNLLYGHQEYQPGDSIKIGQVKLSLTSVEVIIKLMTKGDQFNGEQKSKAV